MCQFPLVVRIMSSPRFKLPSETPVAPPSGGVTATPAQPPKKSSDLVLRASTSLLMAYGFLAIIGLGPIAVLPVIVLVMGGVFREILRISQKARKDRQLPYFRALPWYFLTITLSLTTAFNVRGAVLNTFPQTAVFYNSFGLIAFSLYMFGFVGFVMSLRQGMYRYQFAQFTWMAMTLVFVVVQGSLQVTNMMRGMIWFLLPVSCVVHNDIWAYGWGRSFGRTSLLKLSPKKTVEGFVGAWLFTMIWGFWFAGFLAKFPQLTCPKADFVSPMSCEPSALFEFVPVSLPSWVAAATGGYFDVIEVCPVQYHALVLGAFASLLAPFGGFFASGLKRAHKIKDFGDLIPGHGGMTDRMDCQIMTGFFTYVYLESFVFGSLSIPGTGPACPTTAVGVLACVNALAPQAREELLKLLGGVAVGV